MRMLSAIASDPDEILVITLRGKPASKSRPRFGKGGRVYSSQEQRAAERATAMQIRAAVKSPMTGNVALACVFYRPNRQRIDVDNMLKHVCDAANGIAWHDDSQVTSITGVVELDEENPRTVIAITQHATSMTRGADAVRGCAHCGAPVSLIRKTGRAPKYCSPACRSVVSRVASIAERPCPHCRAASIRGSQKAAAAPFSKCSDCGAGLSHRRGGRCRECWRKSRRAVEIEPIVEQLGLPASRETEPKEDAWA
jgi:Holliday junction resolvase RusA-like endonuclease